MKISIIIVNSVRSLSTRTNFYDFPELFLLTPLIFVQNAEAGPLSPVAKSLNIFCKNHNTEVKLNLKSLILC